MCANCVTALDAMAVNTVGAAVLVTAGWERARDRLAGRSRAQAAARRYLVDAEFVRSLELDPEAVLGPEPTSPESEVDPRPRPHAGV